jgi:hypothetical protein
MAAAQHLSPHGWVKAWLRVNSEELTTHEANVQVFGSVGWIDRRLLWIFEMVSSLAVILLAFGLVTSQTNVQTHGAILANNPMLQDIWAWTQNIAIDMSLLGAIIRCAVYGCERELGKAILYGLLALLLLFTAFIVSDVEAIYQSVQGLTLDTAWSHLPLVNVELLTSVRSFAIVLLLVAHAVQYIHWYRATYQAKKAGGKQAVDQVNTPIDVVNTPVHLVNSSVDSDRLDKLTEMVMKLATSVSEINQTVLTITQNNNYLVSGERLQLPLQGVCSPGTQECLPPVHSDTLTLPDVPGISSQVVDRVIRAHLEGTSWRDIPGNYTRTIRPIKEAWEAWVNAGEQGEQEPFTCVDRKEDE